ncbi:MAG: transporter substrate-binding domain-containing protein [Deltaproteobacteria bacterium]|nr:transporter substrate-binding domain-containing protein [Deltaproteobacteria bacterium]
MALTRRHLFPTGFFALVIILVLTQLITFSHAEELTKVEAAYLKQKDTIVFISQTHYPPFEFVGPDGDHTGMCIELVRWIATQFGFKAHFTDMPFKEAQQAILSGKVDVLTSLFFSEKRDKIFDFTKMMFQVPASIFVVAERPDIKEINDLKDKTIAMQAGDYALEFLETKNIVFEVVYTKNFAEATNLVIAGKADAIIGDEQIVLYHIFSNHLTEKIKKVGEPLYIGQNCMGAKGPNPILISILNKGIDLALKQGVLDRIQKKWIGTQFAAIEPAWFKYVPYLLVVIGMIILLSASVWFWNVKLRQQAALRTEALKNSEERFRFITEKMADIVWTLDLDFRTTYVSPSIKSVLGFTPEERKRQAVEEMITPESLQRVHMMFLEELAKDDEGTADSDRFVTIEVEYYHRDGSTVWLENRLKAIRDPSGSIIGFHGVSRDITERKRAEEALRESEEKLARSKKMESLGLLAGGVAHDLNNVLSGIVSYPELLLLDLPEDSKFRKPIETIQESGHRAAAIVQDLLTVARGVATTKEVLNLNDLIGDYLNSPEFKKLKQFHPIVSVKTNLDTDLFNISGSHVHIRKVVMNLVSNASEAIDGSGNVTISTMNRYVDRPLRGYDDVNIGEYIVLSVSDDGSGISSYDLERIFEPFYTKKVMGRSGTGLGLAVVWNTVQDHKGYIDVTTDENGTTFELYFPITRGEISDKALSIPIKDYKGNQETILVVDDVESQREISCKMLDTLGYKTKAVSSGEEAVEYLKENTVDLILLDMIMDPGINGLETYERIIKIHTKQKAIIVSGFAETDKVKEAQKLGAGHYIKKPVTLEKIGLAVKEELEK